MKFKTPTNIGLLKTKIKFYNDKTKELTADEENFQASNMKLYRTRNFEEIIKKAEEGI